MGLPRKLKQMILHANGLWIAENVALTLPKLTRQFEEFRGGGMNRPVKIDMGGEALEVEWTCGGHVLAVLRQYGEQTVGAVMLRFTASLQNDDTGEITAVEVVMRGRHEEIDRGDAKPGEDTEVKVKTALSYYKESWNGVTEVEIDVLGMVERVGGIDRMAVHRAALGLA